MACRFEAEQWLPLEKERVFRFFASPENLPRISPPQSSARLTRLRLIAPPQVNDSQHLAGAGSEVEISIRAFPYFPFRLRWMARITEFAFGEYFQDLQIRGPFRKWEHRHEFATVVRDGRPGTLVRDVVEYEVGHGLAGWLAERWLIRRMIEAGFDYRHRRTAELLRIEESRK